MVWSAVVAAVIESLPIAILSAPVVFDSKALLPIAVLPAPVVFAINAL